MEFGKVTQPDLVDFSLPPEPVGNAAALRRFAADQPAVPALYIGATGYNMRDWVGKWYPPGCDAKSHLRHYGAQFNTIEHNTTHYRIPDAGAVRRWVEETPADFRFSSKIPQSISHRSEAVPRLENMRLFSRSIQLLGDKLGPCFWQAPPYCALEDYPGLLQFIKPWCAEIPIALEVRHERFFQENTVADLFFEKVQALGISMVITDVGGRRDVCHCRITAPVVLIRFVGCGLHPSDYRRVDAWAERLKIWFAGGLHAAYFFCHEPDNILAPELAAIAHASFSKAMPGIAMRGPKPFDPLPKQGTLF